MLNSIIAMVILLSPISWATDQNIQSGKYEELLIATDLGSHQVTGYFRSETGQGQFSCIFFFKGTISNKEIFIESYYPETHKKTIKGILAVVDDKSIQLKLNEEHGGCWNVRHFADANDPAILQLDVAKPQWTAIKILKEKKAYFYDSPGNSKARKTYLVRGDAVGLMETKGEWLKVEYLGEKKAITGWIKKQFFY